MTITFRVRVTFDAVTDITAYIRTDTPIIIRRGFRSEADRIATIGTATFTVNNQDKRFTPNYGAGPYFGYLTPQRLVTIEASPDAFATVTWGLFYGNVKRLIIDPDVNGQRTARFECEDALGRLARQRFSQPLQENRTADQLYALILAATFRGVAASGYVQPADVDHTGSPNDGDTVTVGDLTYTFRTAISVAYDVLIGAAAITAMANLAAAINTGEVSGEGAGTIYGAGTVKSLEASAAFVRFAGQEVVNKVNLTALYRGALGNAIGLSTASGGRLAVKDTTLTNGTDAPVGLTNHETGQRTYTIAMDRWSLDNTNAGQALEDVALSEFGWLWVAGNGTITTKSYHWEQTQPAAAAVLSLNNTHSDMQSVIDDDNTYNRVEVTNTPRREVTGAVIARATNTITVQGTTATERWNQTMGLPGADADGLLVNSVVIRLPYVDSGTGIVTGAKDVITPIRGTDFTINDAPDGSGFNYTTNPDIQITCSVVVMGSGVEVTFMNNATGPLYVFGFQVRGTRIEQYDPQVILREDTASITAYGEHTLPYNLPLDAGDNFPPALANHLLGRYKTPVQVNTPIVIEDALTAIGGVVPLSLDIGQRIDVIESQTVTDEKALIRALDTEITGTTARLTIHTKSLTTVTYWILEDAVYGVLGTTTRLGL